MNPPEIFLFSSETDAEKWKEKANKSKEKTRKYLFEILEKIIKKRISKYFMYKQGIKFDNLIFKI